MPGKMATTPMNPDFIETSKLRKIPPSKLDLRTDEDIIASLYSPPQITSEKNIWAFWDTGFNQLRPYVRRNILGWVRRLGPLWTVRLLDHVPGSANNVENYVPSSWLHSAFTTGTMTGEWVGPHKADLIRLPLLYLYGGIWMDAGTMLLRHVDDICWNVIEDPHSTYKLAGFGMGGNGGILNGFIATKRDNPFIKRWHDIYTELWKDRTSAIGIHNHPLVREIRVDAPKAILDAFGNDRGRFNDYVAHFLAFEKAKSTTYDDINGPDYWKRHAYVLPIRETIFHQIATEFDGHRQLDLLKLPREALSPKERNQDAEVLFNELLSGCSTMKISHGIKNDKVVFLADLWDLPENEDIDIVRGSYAAYLRWGSENLEQTRIIRPLAV